MPLSRPRGRFSWKVPSLSSLAKRTEDMCLSPTERIGLFPDEPFGPFLETVFPGALRAAPRWCRSLGVKPTPHWHAALTARLPHELRTTQRGVPRRAPAQPFRSPLAAARDHRVRERVRPSVVESCRDSASASYNQLVRIIRSIQLPNKMVDVERKAGTRNFPSRITSSSRCRNVRRTPLGLNNPKWPNRASTIWHTVRSIPHGRCTCSGFKCQSGISRYSVRIRLSTCSCGMMDLRKE